MARIEVGCGKREKAKRDGEKMRTRGIICEKGR